MARRHPLGVTNGATWGGILSLLIVVAILWVAHTFFGLQPSGY